MEYSTLNKEQYDAVMSTAPKRLLLAGAGTGKTYSLVAAISKAVKDGAAPESILVLTFTNAAALEMSERYRNYHPGERSPEFRTFHAFCYHLIGTNEAVRNKIGYTSCPSVLTTEEFRNYQVKAKMISGCKLSDAKLEAADLSYKDALDQKAYRIALTKLLRRDNVITFGIMCSEVCKLFTNNEECVQRYINQYRHIFVDEFQDTDPSQWEFVKSFTHAKILIVGDALQALYSFRGADSSIIKKLASDNTWETHILNQNYRSTSEICNFANENSVYADDAYRVPLVPVIEDEGIVEVKCIADPRFDSAISADCRKAILNFLGEASGTTAILARTNKEVSDLGDFLMDNHRQYSTNNKNEDTINTLKAVKSTDFMCTWLSTMLRADKYYTWAKLCALEKNKPEKEQASDLTILTTKFLNSEMQEKFNTVCEVRNIFKKDISRLRKMVDIASELRLPVDLDIDTIVNTAPQFIDNIITALQEYKSNELYIGTIHSVKGLEYDNVVLLNVDTKVFPLQCEDMLNLYYVGITRAKKHLVVLKQK